MRPSIPLSVLLSALIWLPCSLRAEGPGDLPLRDDFDSKPTLNWETIRPDPSHLSFETHPGKLTITTQYGSIHASQTSAKNLFFLDVPEGVDDFVVTTCVENFLPEKRWQQAGLMFYNDDDNFLKWVRDYNISGSPDLNIRWEVDQVSDGPIFPIEISEERFWLRAIKRGDIYQFLASVDGKEFTTYGVVPWEEGSLKKIGLVAKNGPTQGDLEAQFDFFELRDLTEKERNDSVYAARLALQGDWKAVARQLDGKPITKGPTTQVHITPGTLTLHEGRRLAMSYTIDLTTTPNRITLIARQHGLDQLMNGVYSLEEDTLLIGLNPKVNAPAPESLDSVDGDGLMFLKLERVKAEQ